MKKEVQRSINQIAEAIYTDAMSEYERECRYDDCERLLHCQAWVYETTNYYLLRSYDTIVAVIDKTSYTIVDVLRMVYGFTRTSAQHIAKFRKAACYGGFGHGKWGCEHGVTWRNVD